jgi:hypothetical protein
MRLCRIRPSNYANRCLGLPILLHLNEFRFPTGHFGPVSDPRAARGVYNPLVAKLQATWTAPVAWKRFRNAKLPYAT